MISANHDKVEGHSANMVKSLLRRLFLYHKISFTIIEICCFYKLRMKFFKAFCLSILYLNQICCLYIIFFVYANKKVKMILVHNKQKLLPLHFLYDHKNDNHQKKFVMSSPYTKNKIISNQSLLIIYKLK